LGDNNPVINSPFLTDLDSRAAIKGSRDPLGIQSIWTRFGRHVVGNLTTVTNSVKDFTTLLLGYHFAAQVAEVSDPGSELSTFLKWEQLAGYARGFVNEDWEFRGTERARQRVRGGDLITVSAGSVHQLLSNQKLYGLWGLYTVSARASGLLDGDPARLTPAAVDFVEEIYLPQLATARFRDGQRLVEKLAEDKFTLNIREGDKRLLMAIGGLYRPRLLAKERDFYRQHLLYGLPQDSTAGRQKQLVDLLEPKLRDPAFPWSSPAIEALAKESVGRGVEWQPLAKRLQDIAVVECVMAPSSMLFSHLLGCEGQTIDEVGNRIRRQWGARVETVDTDLFVALRAEVANGEDAVGERWVDIAQALIGGDYARVIRRLLGQNQAVMQMRGGAGAWIREENGRLRVQMSDERGALPERTELPTLWRFPYFLNPLVAVAFQLKENSRG